MEKRVLYAYTTETYKASGLVKVGDSLAERYVERINEQFGTSNPEHPEYVLIGELPRGIRDHQIHAQLIRNGFKKVQNGPGQEWFHANFADVKRAYNQVVNGTSRTQNHILRSEQLACIEKARKWFAGEYPLDVYRSATHSNRFLLNAKMRFGKCFTSIHLAKALGSNNTLIVTYKPDVIGEWIDTVNDQVDFRDWTGVRAKRKADRGSDPCLSDEGQLPKCDGPLVLCVSLQDLSIDEEGNTKDRLQFVPQIQWDLVIFDEVHFGSRTPRAEHILNSLRFTHRLDLSGTPFRIIEQDDFCSQQVFTYSYLDEQKKKKDEILNDPNMSNPIIYRQLPDLDISTI